MTTYRFSIENLACPVVETRRGIFRNEKTMKQILASAALLLYFAVTGLSQGTCTRHTETTGGFSYCPPAGWVTKISKADTPYTIFLTPEGAAVRANMNVKDEVTSLTHNEYMAAALKILLADNPSKGAEATKVIGWTDFTTDSRIPSSRMVYERLYNGVLLRTVQYVFELPGRKLILTGTGLESTKNTNDPIFDAVAKSMRTF